MRADAASAISGAVGPAASATSSRTAFSDAHWRSLKYFNAYRSVVAALLLIGAQMLSDSFLGAADRAGFFYAAAFYLLFAVLCFLPAQLRAPELDWQLTIQVSADIVFIVWMMHASGGIVSGLGLMLLAVLAGAGLISRGRLTLFYSALASIAVLLQQTYQVLQADATPERFLQAGLLSMGYFATAWVGHVLARYTVQSEALAAQREADLASMAEVNQRVIQDMDAGVVVVDAQGGIRSLNAKAHVLLGALPTQQSPARLADLAPNLAARMDAWRQDASIESAPLETMIAGKPVSARFVPVGSSASFAAIFFLEDLSRIQEQARQMKLASLGRLTANIAHEIRNPLSAISHATELLQEEAGLDETATRLLNIIHDNTQRLDRMVQDVLKLNRRDRAHTEQFSLAEFLQTFAHQFCSIERVEAGVLRLQLDSEPVIRFDRSHLNQVMWNLCRNALRHCRGLVGSIVIRTERATRDDRVRLHVIDDGPGVAARHRAHLFEPFFTTVSTGTGLGLYIAREVCEANGASLHYVESPSGGHFCLECRLSTVSGRDR